MPDWLQALILGIVQGLTEFLPVSSSGHLVLAQALLGDDFEFRDNAVLFDLVLHLGTLLPVVYFYRKDIMRIVIAWLPASWSSPSLELREDRMLGAYVVFATIPTAIIALLFKEQFEALFHNVVAVAIAFSCTGVLLYATRFVPERGRSLDWKLALLLGVAQGIAITPGISRSGTTIAVALLFGLAKPGAARFSFLLSIPAILGAMVLSAKDFGGFEGQASSLVAGFAAAMLVGYAALVLLVKLVKAGKLQSFSYYLWALSAIALSVEFVL